MRRCLRLSSLASQLPSSFPARSLAGPARAVRRAPAPAPSRSQSVFHANPRAASFPSAVTAPLPPGLPAFSPAPSPAPRHLLPRAPCPPPASGRAPDLPRPAWSTPTWAIPDSGGPGWSAQDPARPRPESGRRLEEVVGKEPRKGPPARNPRSGSSVGVAGPRGLDSQRMSAVQPKAGGAPLGGPWSERGRTESRVPGSRGAHLHARALVRVRALGRYWRPENCFYSFNFEITLAESPRNCVQRRELGGGRTGIQKWTFGDPSDSLNNSWS